MIAQGNVTHLLVGKNLAIATGKTRAALATGEIGVFEVGSQTSTANANALATNKRVSIATKNSKGVIVESPVFSVGEILSKAKQDAEAPAQRVRAIGYNGTNGSIDEASGEVYTAHIFWKDNSCTFANGTPAKFGTYESSQAATQAEIAAGLAASFNKNSKHESLKIIKAEVLINNDGASLSGTGALTFVNGSKYVTAATNGGAVLSAGDFLRVGTTKSSPCYKVVAVTSGVNSIITLDTPYQGVSATVSESGARYIAAADAATSDAGILLSALETTQDFAPGVIRYDFTEFEIELGSGFGATPQSVVSNPTLGAGTYFEVAQNEWFLKGNRGEQWRVGSYPKDLSLEATFGKNYNQISINYQSGNVKTIDRIVNSYGTVMIAIETGNNAYSSLCTMFSI